MPSLRRTAASHVFLMEPVMNPALEAQAIGRAWRMGQLRPVTVYKLYVKDSVEQRIRELVQLRASSAGAGEASSAMEALRAQKGKQKMLVSEVRRLTCCVLSQCARASPGVPLRRLRAPSATTARRCA